jgi:hypothetical protein
MKASIQRASSFDDAADGAVALGNRLLDENADADPWDVASGLLAGAVHFWLYSRQPCGDAQCLDCADISSAEQRLERLVEELRRCAEESTYYHSPNDHNVGRA